jgi:hypothetical protein
MDPPFRINLPPTFSRGTASGLVCLQWPPFRSPPALRGGQRNIIRSQARRPSRPLYRSAESVCELNCRLQWPLRFRPALRLLK